MTDLTCTGVKKAIRAQMPKGLSGVGKFDVRRANPGFAVIIPAHRAMGADIPRQRFQRSELGLLVDLTVSHFTQHVPYLAGTAA